jgi:peptidoglycan/LPS O-acetylase OafA/YrhL
MSTTPPTKHLLFLDGLRACAAMYVVAYHCALHYFQGATKGLGYQSIFLTVFDYGHYAVNLFIVLSGFSLMISVTKHNYRIKGGAIKFMMRRARRILPPYYMAMLLSVVLIYFFIGHKTDTHWDISVPITSSDIIQHLLLIYDFSKSGIFKINHVFWSIAVEFRIYLFFPLLVAIYRRKGIYPMLFSSLIIATLGFIGLFLGHRYYSADIALSSSGVTPYIILFSFGMIAADLAFSKREKQKMIRLNHGNIQLKQRMILIGGALVFALAYLFLVRIGHNHKYLISYVREVMTGAVFAYILFLLAIFDPKCMPIIKALSARPMVFIGAFSYSLYLIHAPIIQLLSEYVLDPMQLSRFTSTVILIFIGLPVIIGISYLFFLLFERPFLTKIKAKKQIDTRVILASVQKNA